MTEDFNYDRVMEIAARLEVLGVPRKTLTKIRKWAEKERALRLARLRVSDGKA